LQVLSEVRANNLARKHIAGGKNRKAEHSQAWGPGATGRNAATTKRCPKGLESGELTRMARRKVLSPAGATSVARNSGADNSG